MSAVFLRVLPRPGRAWRCFDSAADFAVEPRSIDGFVSVERWKSPVRDARAAFR